MSTTAQKHYEDLLLPYVENLLDPTQRRLVQDHLEICLPCAAEARELDDTVRSLRIQRGAFCPEPHLLHELAESGESLPAQLAEHLAQCPLCTKELLEYRSQGARGPVPPPVAALFRQHYGARGTGELPGPDPWWKRWALLLSPHVGRPLVAAVCVAALVIAAVFVFQVREKSPAIDPGRSAWEGPAAVGVTAQEPISNGTAQPRLAAILYFKDFKSPISQSRIDSFYSDFGPTSQGKCAFSVLTPAQLQQTFGPQNVERADRSRILTQLHDRLNVSRAIVVTVISRAEGFTINGELTDIETGRTLAKHTESGVTESDLDSRLRHLTSAVWCLPRQ